MSEFDQILIGNITVKRNGVKNADPDQVSNAIRNLLENIFDPMGEECEHNLEISVDVREL